MLRHAPTALAALALAVAPLACSGDDGGAPPATTEGEAFVEAYLAAQCARAFGCCSDADITALDPPFSTEAECRAFWKQLGGALGSSHPTQATYSPAKGDACLAEVAAAACTELLYPLLSIREEATPSCPDAFEGKVAEGDPCNWDWDCVRKRCVHTIDSQNNQTSSCDAGGQVGEACDFENQCDHALYCDQPDFQKPGTCAPRLDVGATCTSDLQCKQELRCDAGACAPRGASGAACSGDLDCAPGLRCEAGACAPLGGEGATCAYDSDCASFACTPQKTCAGTCDGA